MKLRADIMFFAACSVALLAAGNAFAVGGRLSPQNFNKMYFLAQHGKVGILREAVNRGLNLDAVNPNGDTGLCIAVKRKDYVAYNTFRMSGANPRHPCTYRIYKEYQAFLEEGKAARAERVVGNEESLYFKDDERSWWPWILGGAALGGGAWALSSGGGGSKPKKDSSVITPKAEYGLTGFINDYYKIVEGEKVDNKLNLNGSNPDGASVVDSIKMLPNMLDNVDYLRTFIKISDNGVYNNKAGGSILLGDASVGLGAYGKNSIGNNDGTVLIDARNGTIGLAASNGSAVFNNPSRNADGVNGKIDMAFKGGKEGDAVIGMYADTGATAINYGEINGTTTLTTVIPDDDKGSGGNDSEEETDEEGETDRITSSNSGSLIGMAAFDFYTGTNNSATTVNVENNGDINLSAGYNAATDISVNLVGMGSYIDDRFLNGTSNPSFAEHMQLDNKGDITLQYDGIYQVSDVALKLGDGGLIGMRADASTQAVNTGNIDISLTSTQMDQNIDVATGMLSVHGAELINGMAAKPYKGTGSSYGTIRVVNEATSGGVVYGMLAAKGDGTQTKIYKWKAPKLRNYGFIDMQASNAYAMASFAGGSVINSGVINLGVDKGDSRYIKNYGIYGAGGTDTSNVTLTNEGIINVYSQESTAIYNAFSGSVSLVNNGNIYVSNKATKSHALGGNFSEAVNKGTIEYKVGNSEKAEIKGTWGIDKVPSSPSVAMDDSVVDVGDAKGKKQLFINDKRGKIIVGDVRQSSKDYGGTYVTAGVRVKNQGAASNEGTISLVNYDVDTIQVDAGMWLDDTTTNEAYINNRGNIKVSSTGSIGMRNASQGSAEATNYGYILVDGLYGYGMSTRGSSIFNGRAVNSPNDATGSLAKTIDVSGYGSSGMYIYGEGTGYNYGDIRLIGPYTNAVVFHNVTEDAGHFFNYGNILWTGEEGQTFYWLSGSTLEFDNSDLTVDGYTYIKATDDSEATFKGDALVTGENSHLFRGEKSSFVNEGDIVVKNEATAIKVKKESKVTHGGGSLTVGDASAPAIGIDATDKDTEVILNADVTVNNGTGVVITSAANVINYGTVQVNKGVGLDISGMDSSGKESKGENSAVIGASGSDAIGVKVMGAEFVNNASKSIDVSDGGTGVLSNAVWTNDGHINVSGASSRGVEVLGGAFTHAGKDKTGGILISGGSSPENATYGIYAKGGIVTNEGNITGSGIGIYGDGGRSENTGLISLSYGIGIEVGSGTAINEGGTINVSSGSAMATGQRSGSSGSITNAGTINTGSADGMTVGQYGGNATNQDTIATVSGDGMSIYGSGSIVNKGTINVVNGNGMGVYSASAQGVNNGTINVGGSGYGAYVTSGSFTNSGTINYHSKSNGECANIGVGGECIDLDADEKEEETPPAQPAAVYPVYVGDNAQFINIGVVDMAENDIDFDVMRGENGSFVVGNGGSYKATSFKGEVVAGKDIVMNGFSDVYVNENSFEGTNAGLSVSSQSYLFDAKTKEHDDVVDVELNRKKFEEVVEEKDLAQFFETNYQAHYNEKMYNALKSAETEEEFNNIQKSESGKKFYANLPRENMAVLRGLNNMEQNRIVSDGLSGAYVGMDYYRTGKDGTDGLSGYADDVYSPYVGVGKRINRNWSIGGGLRAAYADAQYDDIHSKRNNKILLASLPVLYQNGDFKFLTTPSIGFGLGTYERQAVSGSYEADTKDLYYGMYNHAEYSVDMKVAELVFEAELNLQGSSMARAKEDNEGLNLASNDSLSLESGVGVKLRKKIELAKQRSLMLALGVKYYQEYLDPYDDLTAGANGSNYRIKGYDEDKSRIRTTAEAVYKDGGLSIAAEIAHNAEKEESVEGGVGVRYNF